MSTTEESELEQLRNRVEQLEQQLEDDSTDGGSVSRRGVLAALGVGALGVGASGNARGQVGPGRGRRWRTDQDAQGYGLFNVGELSLVGQDPIKRIGDGLSIDSDGTLFNESADPNSAVAQWEDPDDDGYYELTDSGSNGVVVGDARASNVGTSSDPVDQVTATAIDTDQALIGSGYQNPKPEDGTEGIQAAIDALPSDGGVVHLQNGVYEVNNVNGDPYDNYPINIKKDNVAIIGEGWGTVIYLPDGMAEASDGTNGKGARIIHNGRALNDPGTGVYDKTFLINFAVNGNQQNNGGTGDGENLSDATDGHNINLNGYYNWVHNVKSVNATGDGIELISFENPTTCKYNIVSNCWFEDNYEQDLHNHGASVTRYTGNICLDEKTNGSVYMYTDHCDAENIWFDHNYIRASNSDWTSVVLNTNTSFTVRNVHFENNIVENSPNAAVKVRTNSGGNAEDIYIENNTIRNAGTHGIDVRGCENLHIKNNTITECGARAIEARQNDAEADFHGLYIENNFLYNNNQLDGAHDAINIQIDGQDLHNVRVRGNDMLSDSAPYHRRGIQIKETSVGSYQDVMIESNWTRGIKSAPRINDQTASALQRNNPNANDFVSSPPSSFAARVGLWYYDDGANTGSGTFGKRVYDGSAWQDAWTL
jgi:hypothetical protein